MPQEAKILLLFTALFFFVAIVGVLIHYPGLAPILYSLIAPSLSFAASAIFGLLEFNAETHNSPSARRWKEWRVTLNAIAAAFTLLILLISLLFHPLIASLT